MPTSLRFPPGLPPPVRIGYTDTHEETRSRVEMDIGAARMRNRTRVAPLLVTAQWSLTPDQYAIFDVWFEEYLGAGERPFDIQLANDVGLLSWYTVYWIGEYDAEVVEDYHWLISGTLRSLEPSFAVRPSGTDELMGFSAPEVIATGAILIEPVLYGRSFPEVTARGTLDAVPLRGLAEPSVVAAGRLEPRPFWGSALLEVSATGRLEDLGAPELILQFDAVPYAAPAGSAVDLQFDDVLFLPPSIPPP